MESNPSSGGHGNWTSMPNRLLSSFTLDFVHNALKITVLKCDIRISLIGFFQIFRTLTSVSALAFLGSLGDSVSQRIVCDLYKKSLNNEDVRLLNKNFLAQNLQLLAPKVLLE